MLAGHIGQNYPQAIRWTGRRPWRRRTRSAALSV